MFRFHKVARSSALAVAVVALAVSCNDETQIVLGPVVSDANSIFARYVALGNSITAGFQSGGINDSTQRRSYAVLLSQQMRTGFIYPALAGRGCAPPIINFTTQARFGTGSTGATCDLRVPSFTDLLNNVAVPGAIAADLTQAARTTGVTANVPSPHVHAALFLGGKSQVQKALDNKPTFASVWIGNNELLLPALSGILAPVPSFSPGLTSLGTFQTAYDAGIDQLVAGAPGLEGVLIGVANVVNIPGLFAAESLRVNATFRGQFDAGAGFVAASTDSVKRSALVVDGGCATTRTSSISVLIIQQIAAYRNDTAATGQPTKPPAQRRGVPPYIACTAAPTGSPPPSLLGLPVGEAFVLTQAEKDLLGTRATEINTYIRGKAASAPLQWAYLDPNQMLDSLRNLTPTQIPGRPNMTSAQAPFGVWFSLDGFNPSTLAHRLITNWVIDKIDSAYTKPLVPISVP